MAQLVKNACALRETWVWSLGWEDPLEKEKATHSSILAWRISYVVHGVAKSGRGLSDFHFHFGEFIEEERIKNILLHNICFNIMVSTILSLVKMCKNIPCSSQWKNFVSLDVSNSAIKKLSRADSTY